MLSYGTKYQDQTAHKNVGQIEITQPQIINGGQTAFTLSRIYEECLKDEGGKKKRDEKIFAGKEVLLKIINIDPPAKPTDIELIDIVSKATNQQTLVDEDDRRSNEPIQIKLQEIFFHDYGYFYERKKGEFADGLREEYIDNKKIIKRDLLMRLCTACDYNPSDARNLGKKKLFAKDNFGKTLNNVQRVEEYLFAFKCYERLAQIEKRFSKDSKNKYGEINYGYALRYGKFAVVAVCKSLYKKNNSLEKVESIVDTVLDEWTSFEKKNFNKPANNRYFRKFIDEKTGEPREERDIHGYYRGSTLNNDLATYFRYKLPEKVKQKKQRNKKTS